MTRTRPQGITPVSSPMAGDIFSRLAQLGTDQDDVEKTIAKGNGIDLLAEWIRERLATLNNGDDVLPSRMCLTELEEFSGLTDEEFLHYWKTCRSVPEAIGLMHAYFVGDYNYQKSISRGFFIRFTRQGDLIRKLELLFEIDKEDPDTKIRDIAREILWDTVVWMSFNASIPYAYLSGLPKILDFLEYTLQRTCNNTNAESRERLENHDIAMILTSLCGRTRVNHIDHVNCKDFFPRVVNIAQSFAKKVRDMRVEHDMVGGEEWLRYGLLRQAVEGLMHAEGKVRIGELADRMVEYFQEKTKELSPASVT